MIQLSDVRLEVATTVDRLSVSATFNSELNIINAPNTWGKSTLLQGIVFALGIEGMFSASRQAPLGEAMMRVVDGPRGRGAIVESSVTLTLRNERGSFMRCRRFAKSLDVAQTLVQTWSSESLDGLGSAEQVDTIVRETGSAVRKAGFHKVLADFVGWQLPTVPTFAGTEVPLYLELLFPLFYIEQKFGWSGVAPRVPTYLRIRDPLRRSVEYVLGLSTLDRIKQRNALREELQVLSGQWAAQRGRAREVAAAFGWTISTIPDSPTGFAQRRAVRVFVHNNDGFSELFEAQQQWAAELDALPEGQVTVAADRTAVSRQELEDAERELRRLGASARAAHESISLVQADLDAVSSRLSTIESDMRRFRDIRRLRALGSTVDVPLLSTNLCPTCEQELDGRHVATGEVLSVEGSSALADEERTTLLELRSSLESRIEVFRVNAVAASRDLTEWRERVRLLRDELAGPSAAPSYVEVASRLALQRKVDNAEHVLATVETVAEELDRIARRVDDLRARLAALGDEEQSAEDRATIQDFRDRFRDQLLAYGLSSLPPSEVTIDELSFLPANDGVELAFDVATGMSASDTIRTKWAYYTALLEASMRSPRAHHAGLLILDEPRQQETARESLAAFLHRLGGESASVDSQIIYATSEQPAILAQLVRGISHTLVPTPGLHLLSAMT